MALVPQYLRADEEAQIHRQFQGDTWRCNNQVLWSGILRHEAQRWADEHEMQTLTTAMGPLMDPEHPLCLQNQKSNNAWSKYLKGASAIFAWYISRGESVTVLSPPPPKRFHPSGQTSYQAIEEPIVKGMLGTNAISRIEMVHRTVKGAENTHYQIWPVDNTTTWTENFGDLDVPKRRWRMVKTLEALSNKLGDMEIDKAHQEANEKEKEETKKVKKERKKAEEEETKNEAKKAKKERKKSRKAKKLEKRAKKLEKKAKKLENKAKEKAEEEAEDVEEREKARAENLGKEKAK